MSTIRRMQMAAGGNLYDPFDPFVSTYYNPLFSPSPNSGRLGFQALDSCTDFEDNTITVGSHEYVQNSDRGFVLKQNPLGETVFLVEVSGPNRFLTVDTDPSGNIYAGFNGPFGRLAVMKLSPTGTLVFCKTAGANPGPGYSIGTISTNGNIVVNDDETFYVSGRFDPDALSADGFNFSQFNSSGVLIVSQAYYSDVSSPSIPGGSMAVDPANQNIIYFTGNSSGAAGSGVVMKKGTWVKRFEFEDVLNPGSSELFLPNQIEVGQDGSVYVSGATYNNTIRQNQMVFKLNSSGVLQWSKTYVESSTSSTAQIALDQSDNIYVTGVHLGSGDAAAKISKLNSDGDVQWVLKVESSVSGEGVVPTGDTRNNPSVDSQGNLNLGARLAISLPFYDSQTLVAKIIKDGSSTGTYGPYTITSLADEWVSTPALVEVSGTITTRAAAPQPEDFSVTVNDLTGIVENLYYKS